MHYEYFSSLSFILWLREIYPLQSLLLIIRINYPHRTMATNKKSDTEDSSQKFDKQQAKTKYKKQAKKEIKQGTNPRQKKLTNYFPANSISTTSDNPPDPEQLKLNDLKQQLVSKEKQIQKMREQKQFFQNKYSCLHLESKGFKAKAKQVMIKTLMETAELRRAAKRKIDMKMGYFIDDNRFMEGEDIISIKNFIATKTLQCQQLQNDLVKSRSDDQKDRIKFAITFVKKQITQKETELKNKEKDMRIYRQRLKLSYKQLDCIYAKQKWSVIKDSQKNDRYLPLQLLGKGGFGQVYKCFDLEQQQHVALKVNFINRKETIRKQQALQNFKHLKREVLTHKQLNHENIVQIKQILCVEQDRIVFVMEYCSGPELSLYLKDKKCIEEQDAKKIIYQIFSALNYLNELDVKVIHYDLKPSNVMFDCGVVKILDFGLCKLMDSHKQVIELTSQGVGTYWYLPPECFQENSNTAVNITDKIDVWSVGVIFFQLLYGIRPFGNGKSQERILRQNIILNEAHKLVFPDSNPNKYRVSKQAKQFISECLCYDPIKRLQIREAYAHKYFKQ